MRTYKEFVAPYKNNYKVVFLPEKKIEKARNFAKNIIMEKMTEEHHQIDCGNQIGRFFMGMLGEIAIETLFGIDFIDWSIGDSKFYNSADLKDLGLNIGIKTVEGGKFPVIHKKPKRPEIINISLRTNAIAVCGLASIRVLLKYQDDGLILSPNLRARGVKTGFYGFKELQSFKNLSELKICERSL